MWTQTTLIVRRESGDGRGATSFHATVTPAGASHAMRPSRHNRIATATQRDRFVTDHAFCRLLRTLLLVCAATVAHAAEPSAGDRQRCEALRTMDFSRIPDAPAQLQSVMVESLHADEPLVCKVQGYVGRTGFLLALPLSGWNGKYAQGGCGGACGVTTPWWCFDAVRRGYACMSSDMGHRSNLADWQWARDNIEARVDFGYRSTHLAALAGKAISEAYGGRAPAHAYFMGCSTGGRQAYVLAQRFPDDFDGIIAGAAPHSETGSGLQLAWTTLANMDPEERFILREREARLLHDAVVERCDMNDGIRDGLIGDPRRCRFDPSALACKPGSAGDACLTPGQVDAARKMYAGPVDRRGTPIGRQGGVMPGSELNWIGDYMPRGERQPQYVAFMTSFFRHAGFDPSPPADWKLADFDFDHDRIRTDAAETVYNAQNPDLRDFRKRGGRIVAFQGWSDTSVVPGGTIDYYESVTRTMGGLSATTDFYRLYVVPGMRHCSADSEGGDNIDYLSALEDWVERGKAPEGLVGHQVQNPGTIYSTPTWPIPKDWIRRTRVAFPYPDEARYKGRGDPNEPASWDRVKGIIR